MTQRVACGPWDAADAGFKSTPSHGSVENEWNARAEPVGGSLSGTTLCSSTPLDPLPCTAGPYGQYDGYIRYVDYTYDARGKLMTASNSTGRQEAMTFDYTPMGHMRRNNAPSSRGLVHASATASMCNLNAAVNCRRVRVGDTPVS